MSREIVTEKVLEPAPFPKWEFEIELLVRKKFVKPPFEFLLENDFVRYLLVPH
jgi:hypothetical protein